MTNQSLTKNLGQKKKSEYLLHIFCHQANVCISISQFGEGGVSQLTKQLPKLHLQHTSCLTWVCCCWLLHRNSIQSLCHCCLLPYNTTFQKSIFCPKIYKSSRPCFLLFGTEIGLLKQCGLYGILWMKIHSYPFHIPTTVVYCF